MRADDGADGDWSDAELLRGVVAVGMVAVSALSHVVRALQMMERISGNGGMDAMSMHMMGLLLSHAREACHQVAAMSEVPVDCVELSAAALPPGWRDTRELHAAGRVGWSARCVAVVHGYASLARAVTAADAAAIQRAARDVSWLLGCVHDSVMLTIGKESA